MPTLTQRFSYCFARYFLAIAAFTAGAFIVPATAIADAPAPRNPVLDEQSGSYFQLFETGNRQTPWEAASRIAAEKSFRGRPGRLAVIPDLRTLQFVDAHFQTREPVWTGLRYFCRYRKLLWTSGETQSIASTQGMWMPAWYRNPEIRCGAPGIHIDYMSVYLTGKPYRLQAAGEHKGFPNILVEYPPKSDRKEREASNLPEE